MPRVGDFCPSVHLPLTLTRRLCSGLAFCQIQNAVQGLDPSEPILEKQQERGPTPFQGDHPDLPPLAWTIIWHSICSDHRDWGGNGGLRYWGYVMWDAARLERTREKKRLIQN